MASNSDYADTPRTGRPAPIVRFLGWSVLSTLATFMINNILLVGFAFPGASAVFDGGGGLAWLQAALYVIGILVAAGIVAQAPDRALRYEARGIHRFNIFLVRIAFWIVLLTGIADATIAFMRVENLLAYFVGAEGAVDLGRARFVGYYVHIPLMVVGFVIACFTRTLGFTWLALLIVCAELSIVITRFVFSYEQALMGDLVRYWYAALFLFASAYTLFDEGHVRVDVFYSGFRQKSRGFVNAVGSLALGATTCWVILGIGFEGTHSIINSPIANFEITQTGGVGMFIKYQMAGFLGIFACTMLIQFVSYFFEAVADYRNEPGHRDHEPVTT